MASQPPVTTGFEEECREIHDACSQPRRLGLLLAPRSPSERQQIRAAYRATFGEDLAERLHETLVANQEDELCKLLYLWTLEPAERDAIMVREAVEGGMTAAGHRALVEVFTRRKQNQLFFTKQAYLAKFRRNLEQDMATEPSHPYQRLLVALAASRKSHHDELSQHIAKCDARRLYDAKNGSAGSGVDEAVILEMFSKRSIPQLRLALCSYKHIYGHDYTKALKMNGSGEFGESLRVVVRCIYSPSKYYSKLLQRSMQCAATDKRLVTRAILGSDDVGMDEIKSEFKSSYGRNLADFVLESLPASDYRDFLVAVAGGSVASR
ncbi:annexin Gh1-like [Phragmites australis]|uniref:annexin Gh1-like n=1 Tax=Phragmites australis TaxID=29695 RepID=UPI002D77CBB4|nr:annexin Gh1-like [Phragmites australis]